jgi:Flp pilus assembly protein TadG
MIRPIKITRRDLSGQRRRHWGGSVLEAAIIVPVLVWLSFGMAEFSYFFFVKHTLEGAAREGSRNAIVPNSTYTSAVTAANNSITAAGLNTSLLTMTFKDGGTTLTAGNWSAVPPGDPITTTVTGVWSTIGVHLLPSAVAIPGTKQVIGTCVMRKEG